MMEKVEIEAKSRQTVKKGNRIQPIPLGTASTNRRRRLAIVDDFVRISAG
jgi:hypothetical protein